MRALIPFLTTALAAPMAQADTALLIANTRYDEAQNLRYADEVLALEDVFSDAGFDVIVVENGPVAAMRAGVSELLETGEDGRLVIAVAGHMARSRNGGWILGTDADAPDLGNVGGQGVALDVLLEVASRAPGRAVLLLGSEPRRIDLGEGLARGLGPIDAPQGVTVLSGAPDDLAEFAEDVLLRPGADLVAAVESSGGLRSHGFLSSSVPFLLPDPGAPEPPAGPSEEETALWEAVQELNTAGAYRAYLDRFPEGAFGRDARQRIETLEAEEIDPLEIAEAEEVALGLSREARQQIQRDLSILDYNTRGIDGIFGRGTRGAIRAWQEAGRYEVTGFLTRDQIGDLRVQAAQRAAELEEEDRRRREEQERADRAFWQASGQGATEAGMRDYLERFPNGLFSDIARDRLDAIEAERRAEAEAQERTDWDAVRAQDTVEAYEWYIWRYPSGLFVDSARARINELQGGLSPDALAQAQAQEAALNLNDVTRLLVERRLAGMGLNTGSTDGRFTEDTRRAIARYQDSRGISATGYLDQLTVVRLLAEAIGGRIIE